MQTILFIFGTRPEAIKLAPLIHEFKRHNEFEVRICVTGQHRELLDQVLSFFSITPDYDLALMRPNQSLTSLTALLLAGLEPIIEEVKPDWIFVQGDTTSALAGAIVAFYNKIRLAHIEAGLRSHDIDIPFPEEMNRVLTTKITTAHFAPTPLSAQNLKNEGVTNNVYIVGNTVIDALKLGLSIVEQNNDKYSKPFDHIPLKNQTILITCHRRESFGEQFIQICQAIQTLAEKYPNLNFVYPLHLNPNIKDVAEALLKAPNIFMLKPLEYPFLIWIMNKSHIILTDSGGIQEEAPTLGKPLLVLRKVTERAEGVKAGTAKLLGTDKNIIVKEVEALLNNQNEYSKMSNVSNPYGNGDSSEQIVRIIKRINTKKEIS